ncbi:hypothetical protein D3C78_1608420 [compost metagenome]
MQQAQAQWRRHGFQLDGVHQIFYIQAQFGVPFNLQPTLKEQRIGILLTRCDQNQIVGVAAEADISLGMLADNQLAVFYRHKPV